MRKFPIQRLSYKEKSKNDFEWAKSIVDHIITNADGLSNTTVHNNGFDYERMLSNYQLYGNIINQQDFERIFNPLGLDIGQENDKIQPYNFSYNIINVLLGEELKRPFNFKAVLENEEGFNERQSEKIKLYDAFIESEIQRMQLKLKEEFQQKNPPVEPSGDEQADQQAQAQQEEGSQRYIDKVMNPDEIQKFMTTKYQTKKEITANKIIKSLIKQLDIKGKKNDAFKHSLLAGKEFILIGILNDNPHLEILNPLSVFYRKSPEVKYVQDSIYAGFRKRLNIADIIKHFGRDLKKKDLELLLENSYYAVSENMIPSKEMNYHFDNLEFTFLGHPEAIDWDEGSYDQSSYTDETVYYVTWISEKKIGFLKTTDLETGQEIEEIVSEGYKLNKEFGDISIEWEWHPETWEAVRIGQNIYCGIRPCRVQMKPIDDPYSVKLNIVGLIYENMNTDITSVMDRMKPYQFLYFVIMHKFLKLVARDRGKTMPIDVSLLDPNIDLEKTLYYLDELDVYVYNGLQGGDEPGAHQRGAINSSIDRSNTSQILNYVNLLEAIEQKIAMSAGVTLPRIGATSANEAVTNAQQNLLQSSHITEPLFFKHEQLWEHVLNHLLETAYECYRTRLEEGDDVKIQFMLDNGSLDIIKLDGDVLNSDIGVYITDARKEQEIINKIEQQLNAFVSNQMIELSDLVKMYKADSLSEIEVELDLALDKKQKQQQAAQERENQTLLENTQKQIDQKNKELDMMYENQEANRIHESIENDKKLLNDLQKSIPDDDSEKLNLEKEKMKLEERIKSRELNLKEKELSLNRMTKEKELNVNKSLKEKELLINKEIKEKEIAVKKIAANKKPTSNKK